MGRVVLRPVSSFVHWARTFDCRLVEDVRISWLGQDRWDSSSDGRPASSCFGPGFAPAFRGEVVFVVGHSSGRVDVMEFLRLKVTFRGFALPLHGTQVS